MIRFCRGRNQIGHIDDNINISTGGSETDAATESGAAVAG